MKKINILILLFISAIANAQITVTVNPAAGINYAIQSYPIIGNIYNKGNWSNLSDFTQTGYTVSSGTILSPSNGQSVTNYLSLTNPTMLDRQMVCVVFKYTGFASGDSGLYCGFRSSNTTVSASTYGWAQIINSTTIRATLWDTYTNVRFNSSSNINVATNDLIQIEYSYIRGLATCTVTDLTKGTSSTVSVQNTYSYSGIGIGHNTSRVSISTKSNTQYSILQFRYTSFDRYNPDNLFIGNSITAGSFCGSPSNRFAELLGGTISAGGGDKTAEVVSRITEITTWIKPKNVFIEIGVNDLFQSVSSGTWQANMQSINTSLVNAGIRVIWICSPASNGASTSTLRTYLLANFPNVIDCYTPTANGTSLISAYDAGDGTHLNSLGNYIMYSTISASSFFSFQKQPFVQ